MRAMTSHSNNCIIFMAYANSVGPQKSLFAFIGEIFPYSVFLDGDASGC